MERFLDFKTMETKELENILNAKLVERANINEEIIEMLYAIENKGLKIVPDHREYSGKYFLLEENSNC